MINTKKISYDLHLFLFIAFILIAIGLLFIYSASSVLASEKYGCSSYFLKKQLIGLGLGILTMMVARYFPFILLMKFAPFAFVSSLLLTLLTLIPGFAYHIHGSSRWLALGRFSFQPSELLKIGLILYIASFLTKKEHQKKSFLHCYLPLLLIIGITSLVLLKQPDFGLTVTLLITGGIMLFVAHVPSVYLLSTIAALIPVLGTLVVMRPYRLNRILSFLNPWSDPQGSGFQIIQSLVAIGSGGLFGLGIGQSKQKFFYLPMQHTDFIFSIIAEETGFFGASLIIILFITLLYVGFRLSTHFATPFSFFATTGFICLIGLETAINIAVATGLAPTKGIGLPFISYGNSALMGNLIILGLIMNMAHHEGKLRQR